ncbi:MAG: hypothetical protein ACLR56_06780 [Oscillospiraceae bacterium]
MKNPIIDGWYADPEARVYNGKVYIYVARLCLSRNSIIRPYHFR